MVSAADAPLGYKCWNGCMKLDLADCPPEPQPIQEVQCWDGSIVSEVSQCPVQQTVACWDGSLVNDASQCPAQPVTRSNMSVASLCGQEYAPKGARFLHGVSKSEQIEKLTVSAVSC